MESEFNDWRSIFLGTFDSNPLAELDTAMTYIKQIVEYNYLLPPNTNFTLSFIQDTLIPIITQILSNQPNSSNKAKLTKFLSVSSLLLPWAFINDQMQLYHSLLIIVDGHYQFFKETTNTNSKNNKDNKNRSTQVSKNPLHEIFNYFISHELFTLMILRMNRQKPLEISHFNYFINLFNQMHDRMNIATTTSLLFSFTEKFSNYFQTNIIKAPYNVSNEGSLNAIFSILIDLSNKFFFEIPDGLLKLIFEYANIQLQNDSARQQNFAMRTFDYFVKAKNRPTQFFVEQIKKTDFLSLFLNRDLNSEVIQCLITLLTQLSTLKCFNYSDFIKIWTIAKNAHNSQLIDVSIDILNGLQQQEAKKFFESQNDESIDFLKLICAYIAKKQLPNDFVVELIQKIIKIAKITYEKDQEKGIKLIHKDISRIYQSNSVIVSICFDRIKQKFDPFILELLNDIAESNEALIKSKCTPENNLFDILGEYLIHEEQNEMIYPIYLKLMKIMNQKISAKIIDSLFTRKFTSADFWLFMNTLLIQLGVYAFNPESKDCLINYIQKTKELPELTTFVNFFKNFMLLINIFEKRIRTKKQTRTQIPSQYEFSDINLIFEDRLVDMILAFKDPNIFSLLLETFNEIYSKLSIKKNITPLFEKLINRAKTDEDIIKVIKIVMKYCEKNDNNETAKVLAHSYVHKLESKNQIHLRVYIDESDPNHYINLPINSESSVFLILVLMSPKLKKGISHYLIAINNNNNSKWLERKNGTVSASNGFFNNTKVQITETNSNHSTNLFESLRNGSFLKRLITLLKENTHKEEMMIDLMKILSILPSDESLQELSIEPKKFLHEITTAKSEYYSKYLLQILLWRLQDQNNVELYKNEIKPFIQSILNKNSTFCSFEILNLLSIYPINEYIEYLLKILANSEIGDSIKLLAISNLYKFDIENNTKFQDNIQLIQEIISKISNKVWTEFQQIIFESFNNKKALYHMSVDALSKKLSNSNYFIEIFSFYLSEFYDNDNQLALLLDLIQKGPTIELATSLFNLIQKIKLSTDIISKITHITEVLNDEEILHQFYKIISFINNRPNIDDFINKINNIQFDQWSITPQKRNFKQFIGLRNLQATCYMNSDLQQLYHIPAFQHLLSLQTVNDLTEPKNVFLNELKSLMQEMSLSKQQYVDPRKFFESFSQLHKGLFFVNEQQDAQEFLQFFLDDLPPDLHKLFEGVMVHKMQGVDDESVYSITEEPFIHLPLQIKAAENMNEAIQLLTKSEILYGDNQYQIDDGSKINVMKSQRIRVLPTILIIQLQRFEFSLNSPDRIKINKRFEIPDHICLQELMETNSDSCNYTLHGVVVHRGEYSHGHYTSLIRDKGNWYKFDDTNVELVDQKTYETEAFGRTESENQKNEDYMFNNSNGYLLFYINDNSTVSGRNLLDHGFEMSISNEIQAKIDQQNHDYLFRQIPFLDPTFNFILEKAAPEQLRDYYFNIYTHSKLSDYHELIIEKLKDLHSTAEKMNDLLNWMNENFIEKVLEVYLRCTTVQITNSLTDLILFITLNIPTDESGSFISHFIDELQSIIPKWRQLSEVCKLILSYLKQNENNVIFAQTNIWSDFVLMAINEIYDGTWNDNVIKINNVPELFEIASLLVSIQSKDSYINLLQLNSNVMKSSTCYPHYKPLLMKCTTIGIFDIQTMESLFPNDFTKQSVMEIYLQRINSENFNEIITKLENELKYKRYSIFDYFNKNKKNYIDILFLNRSFLIDSLLLTSTDNKTLANSVETFLIDQLPQQSESIKHSFLNDMLKKLTNIGNRSQITSFSPFLHILLLLMNMANYPRNQPIAGLDQLKTESPYLLAINSYSNPSKLPPLFISKSKKVLESTKGYASFVKVNQFMQEFLPIIETAPDDILSKILNQTEWKQLFEKYLKASSTDIQYIEKIVEALIVRKDKSTNKEEIVECIVCAMTNYTKFTLQYASSFAKYLYSIIFDTNLNQLKRLFSVIEMVIQERKPTSKNYQEIVQSYTWCISHYMYYLTNHDYNQILATNDFKFDLPEHSEINTSNNQKTLKSQNELNSNKNDSKSSSNSQLKSAINQTNSKSVRSKKQLNTFDQQTATFNMKFFSSFELTPIPSLLNYISDVHRDLSISLMDLTICICTYNSNYTKQLLDQISQNLEKISQTKSGFKMENIILAALKVRLLILQRPNNIIEEMKKAYDKGNIGYTSSKREIFFYVLNKIYEKQTGKWACKFAKYAFLKAKFEKSEEIKFFESALNNLEDDEIDEFLTDCQQSFKSINTISHNERELAASQLEKIGMLIKVLNGKKSKEQILSKFEIKKEWRQQSQRHEKAIENIFGPM